MLVPSKKRIVLLVDSVYTEAYNEIMASIHVRVDEQKKQKFQVLLQHMGLDVSTAILIYIQFVLRNQRLPFTPNALKDEASVPCSPDCELCRQYRLYPGRTVNGFTKQQEEEILRDEARALKGGKRYTDMKKLFASWNIADDGE